MHILYLMNRFPELSQTFIHDQMRYFRSRGHSVHVICHTSGRHAELVDVECADAVHEIGQMTEYFWKACAPLLPVWGARFPASVLAMAHRLRTRNVVPDAIVQAHFGRNAITAAHLNQVLSRRIPVIGVFHGYDLTSEVRRLGFSDYVVHSDRIDLFVAISDLWNRKLHSFGVPAHKIKTIHVGVDASPQSVKRENPASRFVVVSVGRLVEKKGFSTLIDAFASLPPDLAQTAQLLIIGDGSSGSELREQAAKSKAGTSIRFLGALPHKDTLRYIEQGSSSFSPLGRRRTGTWKAYL